MQLVLWKTAFRQRQSVMPQPLATTNGFQGESVQNKYAALKETEGSRLL